MSMDVGLAVLTTTSLTLISKDGALWQTQMNKLVAANLIIHYTIVNYDFIDVLTTDKKIDYIMTLGRVNF